MLDKKGLVSVWIGDFRTAKQLARYLEEMYYDDEVHPSRFAVEFELFDYDDYATEARHAEPSAIADLLRPVSHAASFLEPACARAKALGLERATTAIAIYDFGYAPETAEGRSKYAKAQMTFLGVFNYDTRVTD